MPNVLCESLRSDTSGQLEARVEENACSLSYGRRDGHPSRRRSRTVREPLSSHGSSAHESLSEIPHAVDLIVAMRMEQPQIGVPIVRAVTIPVMHFQDIIHAKA